jgi:hypothetical protein
MHCPSSGVIGDLGGRIVASMAEAMLLRPVAPQIQDEVRPPAREIPTKSLKRIVDPRERGG